MTRLHDTDRCPITTVNYHCWKPCDMHCLHCFARYEDAGHANLPRDGMLAVVRELADGFDRVNFAGGEPTLCPWLVEGARFARELGLRTSIVTNGARMVRDPALRDALLDAIDILALSIDSDSAATSIAIGRATAGTALAAAGLADLADRARRAGVLLKVNTVVQRLNVDEDLGLLLRRLRPDRWKVLRVLPVRGQNDPEYGQLSITSEEFSRFVDRHASLRAEGVEIVPEDHDAMTGSYAMVDPGGFAYDNVDGRHSYSRDPVHLVGWRRAFEQVRLVPERFAARGGNYDARKDRHAD